MVIAVSLILIIACYFMGNISPSTILAKASGHDIKKEGSGNAGATNALRVLGPKAAIVTLIIDIGKGYLAVILGYHGMHLINSFESTAIVVSGFCGLAAFLGHVWPLLYNFQGGKGVATALGTLFAFDWKMAIVCVAVFVIVVAITRMVSLGSILAAISFIFAYYISFLLYAGDSLRGIDSFVAATKYILPFIIMVIVLIYKHKANIERIQNGQENKLSFGKKDK